MVDVGGTVTKAIRGIRRGDPESEDALYEAVIDQLVQKAKVILQGYTKLDKSPEELISDIWEEMSRYLSSHDVKDRTHFLNLACQHFRWKLQTLCSRSEPHVEPLQDDCAASQTGPATRVARSDEIAALLDAIATLPEELQQVIQYHVFLEMSFREIEEEVDIPKATAADRYRKAVAELGRRLRQKGLGESQ